MENKVKLIWVSLKKYFEKVQGWPGAQGRQNQAQPETAISELDDQRLE